MQEIEFGEDFLDIPTKNFEELLVSLPILTGNAEIIFDRLLATRPASLPAPSFVAIYLGGKNLQSGTSDSLVFNLEVIGLNLGSRISVAKAYLDLVNNSPKTVFTKLADKNMTPVWKVQP